MTDELGNIRNKDNKPVRLSLGSFKDVINNSNISQFVKEESVFQTRRTSNKKSVNDPCCICNTTVDTGAQLVALFSIFADPAILLAYVCLFRSQSNENDKSSCLALAIIHCIRIPTHYLLLAGVRKKNRIFCLVWLIMYIILVFISMICVIIFYNNPLYIIVQALAGLKALYKGWVVGLYCYLIEEKTAHPRNRFIFPNDQMDPNIVFAEEESEAVLIESNSDITVNP